NLIEFCGSKGIRRDYSNARTPQQNEVTERKNKTLIEAARTMLVDSLLPTIFWSEAVATACYVLNRVLVTKPHHKTPYELLTRDKPFISYLKPFGCHVTILNTSDPLGKFDKMSNEGYIVGVSSTNLTAGSQGATPSNADNLDELAELQALQRQEQGGKEEVDRLGLAFPSLNSILGVGTASIGSSVFAGGTPPVSVGSTPQMSPCASPIFADRHSSAAGKSYIFAGRPTGSAGKLTGSAGRPVSADGIFIHQEKYVANILKKFDLDNSKRTSTPFEPQKIREKNVPDEPISVHLYRSMIGCLMYLTATRPDIIFAVCAATRHQVTPKTSNLLSVKRIFKYLIAYPNLGLWYPRDSLFDLEALSDNDYAGAHGDRKSTTGGCQFLGRRLISWQCKKQTIVATSSCEAEYVAAASCCGQVLWIQNQLLDYGLI
nr:putative ribonuclease H-like domain-containing protein [Tanacetum cinerariifolium]